MSAEAPERRRTPRVAGGTSPWHLSGSLRPGHPVRLINIGAGGALLCSAARSIPGQRVDVSLGCGTSSLALSGRVLRARLVRLAPLTYEAAVGFDVDVATDG